MNGGEFIFGAGSLARVAEVISADDHDRVLLVCSNATIQRTGITQHIGPEVCVFSDFSPNPRLADVLAGCALAAAYRPSVVVGVGGGSAMDTAKLVRVLPPGAAGRDAVRCGPGGLRPDPPALVLVPTVSGSGSEVTQFASVFADGRKFSVDNQMVRASSVVIDPELAASCPLPVAFSCVFDALAHALESYWSLRSTSASRTLAAEALTMLRQIPAGGCRRLSAAERAMIADAAVRAGWAIDQTRTTAAHAFAYPTTVHFGVAHGLACALHLVWVLDHLAAMVGADCVDVRGAEFVAGRLDDIADLLGAGQPAQSGRVIEGLLAQAGFSPQLRQYGIAPDDLPVLASEALSSERAANLPVRIDAEAAIAALRKRL